MRRAHFSLAASSIKMKPCFTLLLLSFFAAASVAARQKKEPEAPPVVASAQQVLGEISSGQFDIVEGRYDARLSGALAPGQLAMAWGRVLAAVGSFDSVVSARVGKTGTLDVVILECKFQKGEIDAQIAFGPEGKLAGLHFGPHRETPPPWTAPAYTHPDTFTEQPLTLVNGQYELPGAITVPNGEGPFPAVVLLQDSGPHDQDETIGPTNPSRIWRGASPPTASLRSAIQNAPKNMGRRATPIPQNSPWTTKRSAMLRPPWRFSTSRQRSIQSASL
jgi:hypothetical protein